MAAGAVHDRCEVILALNPEKLAETIALADGLILAGNRHRARMILVGLIEQDPGNQEVRSRLDELVWKGSWPELRRDMERKLASFSGAEAEFERSYLSLLFGEMPLGWKQYEARLEMPGRTGSVSSARNFREPRWSGEPFPGRTLLLHFEQGFGDTFMFIRYAKLAKALGGRVLLEAQRQLCYLVSTCPGVDLVIAHGDPVPPFDFQAPLLSLPWIFRTNIHSIPADIPYLDVPPSVTNRLPIAEQLARSEGKVRVGLAWAGGRGYKRDLERSMRPETFAPLAAVPGVAWYSFQLESQELPSLPGIVSLAPLLVSFSDTAYALSGMDLVITVDTALAHLSGAMGIPTLLLLPFQPDFRWMLDRDDSPWYPTMRLYRQPGPGDWDTVARRVAEDLAG